MTASEPPRQSIFLSVGSKLSESQEQFVVAFEGFARANGLEPRALGRNEWSSQAPLIPIRRLMTESSGVVVIAAERLHIIEAIERRGTQYEQAWRDVGLATSWNQVEAAMATALAKPLLVIVEQGVKHDGLIDQGYDWYVHEIVMDPSQLSRPAFMGIFNDFRAQVQRYHEDRAKGRLPNTGADVSKLSVRDLLALLKTSELWKVGTALAGTAAGIAAFAYWLGSTFSGGAR